MDIALNKIAKDEMSKARGNPNYNPGVDSVDKIEFPFSLDYSHFEVPGLFVLVPGSSGSIGPSLDLGAIFYTATD
jgi:hypothetical protein